MLSRTATQLFWLSRYFERSENTARMLDAIHNLALLPQSGQRQLDWEAPLIITGMREAFFQLYPEGGLNDMLHFMIFDTSNPSSIYTSIRQARENAHAVRGNITPDMWESINATWLEMRGDKVHELARRGVQPMLEWVKAESHRFRGVTYGTMRRDEAYQFLRLGTFLERADCTARILDVKYHLLHEGNPNPDADKSSANYHAWGALLRSVSAFETYQSIYRDSVRPLQVAELLLLRADMPRSLHACVNEIRDLLLNMEQPSARRALWLAEELHAQLHYASVDDIVRPGLHDYLTYFLQQIESLSARIHEAYLAH